MRMLAQEVKDLTMGLCLFIWLLKEKVYRCLIFWLNLDLNIKNEIRRMISEEKEEWCINGLSLEMRKELCFSKEVFYLQIRTREMLLYAIKICEKDPG